MASKASVLILEDQIGDLHWLLDLIHNRGHEVVVAANEKAARERLEAVRDGKEEYRLAIVDVMMATRDLRELATLSEGFFADSRDTGIRLCRYARLDLNLSESKLPIVCLTIRHDDQVKEAMQEIGIRLYDRDDDDQEGSIRTLIEERLGPRQTVAETNG